MILELYWVVELKLKCEIDEITSDWKTIPKGLKFLNPSFETVSRDLIGALITEKGIFPPEIVSKVVKDTPTNG